MRIAYHDVVVGVPWQLSLNDKGGSNQRRKQATQRVHGVHDALDGVGLVHSANPGAEGGIGQTVTETAKGVADDEHGVRRVSAQDGVGDNVA